MSNRQSSSMGSGYSMEDLAPSKLPKHIQEEILGHKGPRQFPRYFYKPMGFLPPIDLYDVVRLPPKPEPWTIKSIGRPSFVRHHHTESRGQEPFFRRAAKPSVVVPVKEVKKYNKYHKMLEKDPHNKISFINHSASMDGTPPWCQQRLRTACRSARFELPLDKSVLENMTPLQFLAKFTRLYREQRRRYSRIFNLHKSKISECIEYQNLFPALNTMFGSFLSSQNFDILCTALFIEQDTVLDETTFIGVCTLADRLFWTSYLESSERNTFNYLGPNKSALEYADFDCLKRKLDGVKVPLEIYYLLYSLS